MRIELDYSQREDIFSKMKFPDNEPEMTKEESAFLCGVIGQTKPKSVVEVGIAGGGTTSIILQCLENTTQDYCLNAIDVSENFYKDSKKKSGYLGEEAFKILGVSDEKMHLWLGKPLPYFIDEITRKGKIDLILLDTMHMIPGELLDFLVALPYLSDDAVVCLHDISLNTRNSLRMNEIATNVLYNAVVAEKYINYDLVSQKRDTYPNIAAFRINKDTIKYIPNVFGLLLLNWEYFPPETDMFKYREVFEKNYDSDCLEMFDRAYEINKKMRNGTVKERLRKAAKIMLFGKY